MAIEGTTFRGKQADLLTFAQEMADFFAENKTVLTASVKMIFANEFEQTFQTAIATAAVFPTDAQMLEQQIFETNLVQDALQEGRQLVRRIKRFVLAAFDEKATAAAILGEAGGKILCRTAAAWTRQLEQLFAATEQYAELLDNQGFTAMHRTAIAAAAARLQAAIARQQAAKQARSVAKQERQEAFKRVWALAVQVSKAGKTAFKHSDRSRYMLSLLPVSRFSELVQPVKNQIIEEKQNVPVIIADKTAILNNVEDISDKNKILSDNKETFSLLSVSVSAKKPLEKGFFINKAPKLLSKNKEVGIFAAKRERFCGERSSVSDIAAFFSARRKTAALVLKARLQAKKFGVFLVKTRARSNVLKAGWVNDFCYFGVLVLMRIFGAWKVNIG